MAKQNLINNKHMGDLSFDKPAEILSRMKEIKASLSEAVDENTKVALCLELNALAKAFSKLLVESFSCSDKDSEELINTKLLPNTGISININNVTYSYSKEQVSKPEIDKAYLTSQGVKTQKELYEKWQAEGKVIPACLSSDTKTIISFKPELWGNEPLAHVVTSDVINIKEKEIKVKKVK